MTGENLHYKNNPGIYIGQYYKVYKEDNPCDRNKLRIKVSIWMLPRINIQGGLKIMSLRSIKTITRRSWDMIPMPDTIIDQVDILGKYIFEFTDCRYWLIRYGDVELTGVDGDGGENKSPLQI